MLLELEGETYGQTFVCGIMHENNVWGEQNADVVVGLIGMKEVEGVVMKEGNRV